MTVLRPTNIRPLLTLIGVVAVFSAVSCGDRSPPPGASRPPDGDASTCRDEAIVPVPGERLTCHPGARISVVPGDGAAPPVVVCTCRTTTACACEPILDWD